jgi:hypothetical protein
MTEQFDMTIDVDWAGTQEQRSGSVPPEVGEQEFEITKVFGGIQKTGDNEGAPYTSLLCTQMSGEFPGTRSTFKFLGFGQKVGKRGTTQVGETKAFIVDIGRSDLFEQPGFNANDLVGTYFLANVAHSNNPKNGQISVWLNQPRPSGVPVEEAPTPTPYHFPEGVVGSAAPAQATLPVTAQQLAAAAQAQAPVVEPQAAPPRRMRPSAKA